MNINTTFALESSAPPTGIDKLSITTQDFKIRDGRGSGLTVQSAPVNLSTEEDKNVPLFRDGNGRVYSGQKAYLNHELFAVNINPNGINLVLNPSKPYHPYELCNREQTFTERTETVFKCLYDLGIEADYLKAKIARLDLARNAEMKHPCIAYQQIYGGLGFSRSKRQAMYPDGYSTNNNTFGLTLYDKGKEAQQELNNLLRAELQFKKSNGANFKGLQVYSVNDIPSVGFGHLNDTFTEIMQKQVFKTDTFTGQARMVFADAQHELEAFIRTYGRGWGLSAFIQSYGIEELIQSVGGIDGFKNLLKAEGYHRNIVAKHIKRVQSLLNFRARARNDKAIGKLYRELWLKFAS